MSIRQKRQDTPTERRRAPFLWISKEVFSRKWHLLSDKAARVYVTICAYADGHHSEDGVQITIDSFAVRNRMSRMSLWRAMKELEEHGLIRVENVFDDGGGQVENRYILID